MSPTGLSIIQPAEWAAPRGYSNGILVPADHDLLVMAGQVGWSASGQLVGDDFVSQFRQALVNCVRLVEAAGGCREDLVRFTMFCRDKAQYLSLQLEIGVAYREVMGHHYPCMSLVEVAGLVEVGALIEIEAIAALPPRVQSSAARGSGGQQV